MARGGRARHGAVLSEAAVPAHRLARVFVTGGAGFIGSAVVRGLRARGDEVIAAVRDYGPGDHTAVGEQLDAAFRGRLPYLTLTDLGICLTHVSDLAAGLLAAVARGRVGQMYVLDGEPVRLIGALRIAARLGNRRMPGVSMPTRLLRLIAPLSGTLGGRLGLPANLAEVISAADGVTWASHAKASAELGFDPRPLEAGLRDTFGAA